MQNRKKRSCRLPMHKAARGSFKCNDEELNRIWEVGAYTMHLTTREFFIDGIKRDRWVWSGDAIQSYLMNYYLFFDNETVKRTIWLLRGKDPVTSHSNTIMDYTFYWFLSIYDYYMYSGDKDFVTQLYPRMQSMMDYVLGRTNANGMVEGMTGDWVFVDWADGYLDKKGELSFEQVLFCKSLETMALCAGLAGNTADKTKYEKLASALRSKLEPAFWNEQKQAMRFAVAAACAINTIMVNFQPCAKNLQPLYLFFRNCSVCFWSDVQKQVSIVCNSSYQK